MDRKKEPLALNVLNSQIGLINVLTKPFFEEWTAFLEDSSSILLENLYENIRFWETEGEECIRTHPSFLARWNTKRKLLRGGTGGTSPTKGGTAGGFVVPGAQPVTSPALATLLAGGARGGAGAAAPGEGSPRAKLGDRDLAIGVKSEKV